MWAKLSPRQRLVLLSPIAVFALGALASSIDDAPTVCPFALCTGMACPGCGMTRAVSYLIRGDIHTALVYHPLVPMVSVLAFGGWAWFAFTLTGTVRPISQRMLNLVLIGSAAALLVVWVLRIVNGALPPV